ncbi:MAG TPA: hypothetical protein VF155_10395 [Candidatus Dormibacteraeota bacterium]
MRWHPDWRRSAAGGVAAGGLAGGALVWAAMVVFACTNIMGQLTISPTSGSVGTRITTTASGLVANATYAMHFAKSTSGSCMSFKGVLTLGSVTASGSGAWSGVTFAIPSASMGTHSVCGMETKPVKGGSGTQHDTFTIT